MRWIRLANGDWQAKGKAGNFLITKKGGFWKARYKSDDGKKLFFLPIRHFLSAAKKLCEDNYYWEE